MSAQSDLILVKFPDGAENWFPKSIANDNAKLKEFVRGMGFAELAEAKIERSKDRDGNTVVTLVKQAGKKGSLSPLDALISARAFNNPAVALAEHIAEGNPVKSSRLRAVALKGLKELEATTVAQERLRKSVSIPGQVREEM